MLQSKRRFPIPTPVACEFLFFPPPHCNKQQYDRVAYFETNPKQTVNVRKGRYTSIIPIQWRIQGFPLGGVPTFDVGAFRRNVCENERIGSRFGQGNLPMTSQMWMPLIYQYHRFIYACISLLQEHRAQSSSTAAAAGSTRSIIFARMLRRA